MGELAGRRGALAAAAVVAGLALAGPARAGVWALDYDVRGACADPAGFRARVETQRLRGGDVEDVRVRVSVAADAGAGWRARVEVTAGAAAAGAAGREIDGASCVEVHDAAILIVAQLLDGVARPVARAAPAPRTMSPVPILEEDAVRPRSPEPPVTIRIGAALGGDVGGLAAPTAGGRASLDLGWRGFVLALGATTWRDTTEVDAEGQGLTVSAWQAHAATRVGIVRRVELGAQIEIGELSARGLGVDTVLADSGAWQAVGPAARIGLWRWRGLDVGVDLEVMLPIGRTTFVVDGEVRYRAGTTFRGFVGAAWRLGTSSDGNGRGRP